ncbi:hypothetical protein GUJ93_ZPchr0005g14668 [Zizania palustris]|uniref:Uncharacterized protein n=1 Tax=Zizania palustris TaxID=103762 RepID=A0A8J5SH77_ZIZPA|nr:hypothetical protein GUJ93_ZPchr0005g14668 [Zizania palustris]
MTPILLLSVTHIHPIETAGAGIKREGMKGAHTTCSSCNLQAKAAGEEENPLLALASSNGMAMLPTLPEKTKQPCSANFHEPSCVWSQRRGAEPRTREPDR